MDCLPIPSTPTTTPTHPIDRLTPHHNLSKSQTMKLTTTLTIHPGAKTKGSYLRVHFKNTHEVAVAISGMKLRKAVTYLENVKEQKQVIPFRRFNSGVGRCAQAKAFNTTQGRWPVKSCDFMLGLLKNAESNAEAKGLNVDELVVKHIEVNQAPKQRRRTYRAHGRINPYMSNPCHVEIIVAEEDKQVKKEQDDANKVLKLSKRRIAQKRVQLARRA